MILKQVLQALRRSVKFNICEKKPKYFEKPIIEVSNIKYKQKGQYGVLPPRLVPKNIPRPAYLDSPNPIYGQYEGAPIKHSRKMIAKLQKAGQLIAQTLSHVSSQVKAGMTTDDIDKIAHNHIISLNAFPSSIGFIGFPKSISTSVNEVICNGIPSLRPLDEGDTLNIACTLYYNGVFGSSNMMVKIGKPHTDISKLIHISQKALYKCIKICRPGTPFKQIAEVCEQIAKDYSYVVCELFTGHGIGKLKHMPPFILHHYNDHGGKMEVGNVFNLQPIFLMQHGEFQLWSDQFTIISPDNPSAQWEHTVVITETGCEVLTLRENEIIQ